MYICTCMHMNNMKEKHQLHQPLSKCRLKTLALPENGNRSQGTRTHTHPAPRKEYPQGTPPSLHRAKNTPPVNTATPWTLCAKRMSGLAQPLGDPLAPFVQGTTGLARHYTSRAKCKEDSPTLPCILSPTNELNRLSVGRWVGP